LRSRLRRPLKGRALGTGACGLDAATLERLRRLSPLAPLAVERRALRLAAGLVARRIAPGSRDPADVARPTYHAVAARRIASVLESSGSGVPFYVLAHSHRPEQHALATAGRQSVYLNTGTWSTLVPRTPEGGKGLVPLSFVEIVRGGDGGVPSGRLLRWNPVTGLEEPWVTG
jgi:hypothetical protein